MRWWEKGQSDQKSAQTASHVLPAFTHGMCKDSATSMTGSTTQAHHEMCAPDMSILPIWESALVPHADECTQN